MNWHKKAQNSSHEKWVFGILEQMLKISDNNVHSQKDFSKLFTLTNLLKTYLISLGEITSPEPIRSFILKTKNRLLSQTGDSHKNIGQILVIVAEYENLKDKLKK